MKKRKSEQGQCQEWPRPIHWRAEAGIYCYFGNDVVVEFKKKLSSFILLFMVSIGPNMSHFVLINRMSKDVLLLLKIASRIAFWKKKMIKSK